MFVIHPQDDIRRVQRDLEVFGHEKDTVQSKLEELELYHDSTMRQMNKLVDDKQVPLIS